MASLEVTKTRITVATKRVKEGIERLVGEPIQFKTSKDPEVARAFFLEQLADLLDQLALVDAEDGAEVAPHAGSTLKERLQSLLEQEPVAGCYELEVTDDGEVAGIRRFNTKRKGNAEKVL